METQKLTIDGVELVSSARIHVPVHELFKDRPEFAFVPAEDGEHNVYRVVRMPWTPTPLRCRARRRALKKRRSA